LTVTSLKLRSGQDQAIRGNLKLLHLPPGRIGFCPASIHWPQSRAGQKRKDKTMSKSPSHRAYVASTPKTEGEKSFWREVGVLWPHKNGTGYDLLIHEGISVSGRIVCTEPKEKE
jgi:hypothetical protein